MKSTTKKTSKAYNLLSACFAFLLWGGWAYYVNSTNNQSTGITAGLTQGIASFIITLLMVYFVTQIYTKLPMNIANSLRFLFPALITVSITGTGLFLIHTVMETPNIAKTIAPALSVAFLFSLFTTYQLRPQAKTHNEA